jgi:hypothetical protein
MQNDFHYCCIRCLAEAAGFGKVDSQTIGFASQYVDDSIEHKGIKIENCPPETEHLIEDGKFEPVCSAHKGIQLLTAGDKNVQRKVYIPFHFIPSEKQTDDTLFDYRVHPNSTFARSMVTDAIDAYKKAAGKDDSTRLEAVINIGISLHTFADTWSHKLFSGRWNAADNDIERIHLMVDDKWKSIDFLEQLKYNFLPDIGHAEAYTLPDQSNLTWRYEDDSSGLDVTRLNTEEFLEAARTIYGLLCTAINTQPYWKAYASNVKSCLELPTNSVSAKFRKWQETFPDMKFEYNHTKWREEALSGPRYDWESFRAKEDYGTVKYIAKEDKKWFLFHVAAKKHREKVMKCFPDNLL